MTSLIPIPWDRSVKKLPINGKEFERILTKQIGNVLLVINAIHDQCDPRSMRSTINAIHDQCEHDF